MQNQQPLWKQTYRFFKRLTNFDSITCGVLASKTGKSTNTSEAWTRAPESAENPFGTGYKTPFDMVNGILALAHKEDAGLAREGAESFVQYVDFLDEQAGKAFVQKGGCIIHLAAQSVSETADILLASSKCSDPDLHLCLTEAKQAQAKINQYIACVEEKLKNEARSDAGFNVQAVGSSRGVN